MHGIGEAGTVLGATLKTLSVVGLIVSGLGLLAGVTSVLYAAAGSGEPSVPTEGEAGTAGRPSRDRESGMQVVGVSLMAMGASLVLLVVGLVAARHDRRVLDRQGPTGSGSADVQK